MRTCTIDYATRSQMDSLYYPSISAYLVGRLPNIDFAQDNAGMGYAVFYTPAGVQTKVLDGLKRRICSSS